jgi:isoquinoline 1-oxidoreductase alpha subunit
MRFTVNGIEREVDVEDDMPLLWVLRDELGITGVKYGCGVAQCGACTVHLDGFAVRSCQVPAASLEGAEVVTIEGLGHARGAPCGAGGLDRTSGRAMRLLPVGPDHAGRRAAGGLPEPTDEDIDFEMSGNLCRCGTYPRIRAAIHTAAAKLREA